MVDAPLAEEGRDAVVGTIQFRRGELRPHLCRARFDQLLDGSIVATHCLECAVDQIVQEVRQARVRRQGLKRVLVNLRRGLGLADEFEQLGLLEQGEQVPRLELEHLGQRLFLRIAQLQRAQRGGQIHPQRRIARLGLRGLLEQFARARRIAGLQQVDGARIEHQRVTTRDALRTRQQALRFLALSSGLGLLGLLDQSTKQRFVVG